jgi:two-component system invasion response regulator UvrY
MIRVLIVDDHAIVRQGLIRILEEAKGIRVGGEAANGVEALKMMRTEQWDIVLLDISMPEKNGIDTLKLILERSKESKVLILSMYPEDQHAVRLMKSGASG